MTEGRVCKMDMRTAEIVALTKTGCRDEDFKLFTGSDRTRKEYIGGTAQVEQPGDKVKELRLR